MQGEYLFLPKIRNQRNLLYLWTQWCQKLNDEFQEEDIDGEFQEDDVDEEFMEDDISNEFQEDDLDALLLEDKLEWVGWCLFFGL